MEDDTWSFGLSTSSSRGYQSAFKSNSDLYIDFEEIEEEEEEEEDNYDLRGEYPCPYCTADFDLVELCNHIDDEHHLEAKSGMLEGTSLSYFLSRYFSPPKIKFASAARAKACIKVDVFTTDHPAFRIRGTCILECPVCFNKVWVDMVDHIMTAHGTIYKSLQSLKLRKSESHSTPFLKKDFQDEYLHASHGRSSSAVLSKTLLSFLYNVSPVDKSESGQPARSSKITLEERSSDAKPLERDDRSSPLSVEEHKEKAKRSEFVQGLLLSAMFDDDS